MPRSHHKYAMLIADRSLIAQAARGHRQANELLMLGSGPSPVIILLAISSVCLVIHFDRSFACSTDVSG